MEIWPIYAPRTTIPWNFLSRGYFQPINEAHFSTYTINDWLQMRPVYMFLYHVGSITNLTFFNAKKVPNKRLGVWLNFKDIFFISSLIYLLLKWLITKFQFLELKKVRRRKYLELKMIQGNRYSRLTSLQVLPHRNQLRWLSIARSVWNKFWKNLFIFENLLC